MSLVKMSNPYTQTLEKKELGLKLLLQKSKENMDSLKRESNRLNIGEDSKADEAVLISFLGSICSDVGKAYTEYKKMGAEKEVEALRDKSERIERFNKIKENIDNYTKLNIEKRALEEKLNNQDLSKKEQAKTENSLLTNAKKMNDIADFFGYANEPDFMKNLEISEEKWYGEAGAEYLKGIRELSTSKLGEFVDAGILSPTELSTESILANGVLDNSLDKIKTSIAGLESLSHLKDLAETVNATANTNLEVN